MPVLQDGALVGKLKDKILDSDALKENPEGTVKKMVDLITKLTQGSKAEVGLKMKLCNILVRKSHDPTNLYDCIGYNRRQFLSFFASSDGLPALCAAPGGA